MATQNTRPAVARGHATATPSGIRPADIYYILFRHKWKILFVSLVGIIAASVVWVRWPHYYQSYAELLIKYVQDAKTPAQNSDSVRPNDDIINPELALLRSRDLAERVVDVITPKTILAKIDGTSNRDEAISLVADGVSAESVNRSSVILVTFQHSDPSVVQPVLREIIVSYFKLHAELHKIGELDLPLSQEAEQWRNNLLTTESDLRSARTNAGIISLEDTKKSYSLQLNDIRLQQSEANAEYRERKAVLDELLASQPHSEPEAITNEETIPADVLEQYRRARHMVEYWRKQQEDAEVTYVQGSSKRTNIESQVVAAEKEKKDLEEKTPGLLSVAPSNNETNNTQRGAIIAQEVNLKNLELKIKVLNSRMEDIQKAIGALSAFEEKTTDLERKQKLDEETYSGFAKAVAEARIADRFRNGQVWNISSIQTPTPPGQISPGKKTKTVGMILFGAVGGILALAFFLEMYLDQSLKRPVDVENTLHLPLFLSIPLLGKNGKMRSLGRARKVPLLENRAQAPALTNGTAANGNGSGTVNGLPVPVNADVEPAAWDSRHVLRSYSEALRDRLITYFEVNNLHHKPKLVAVTSCSEKAGVSTIAAGLAASLSETGEGNVLLVDMNELGAAHQFYKGELACGIDDALEKDKRENALVRDNLYVVMEETGNDNLPRALPKRFKHLVPRLRASDYDYIIFDMPPVSQISVTPRLARFMDIMLVVVESEKTDRELVKRATSLLSEADTHVGVVLNKTKNYVPSRLVQGL